MMNIKMLKTAVAGLVLSVSSLANAGLIDFNGMSDGVYSGNSDFTVSAYGGSESDASLIPLIRKQNGTAYLCNSTDVADLSCYTYPTEDIIDFNFNIGLDSFSMSMFWAGNSGYASVSSFDINGVLLETFSYTSGLTATYNFNSVTDIYSIRTDSGRYANIGGDWWYGINSISYTPSEIPEPTTLAIFALGIMGLASRRFKKQ